MSGTVTNLSRQGNELQGKRNSTCATDAPFTLKRPASAEEYIWEILCNDKNNARYEILFEQKITEPVLEIGCHYGYLAALLSRQHEVIAIDRDPEYLRIAVDVAEKNNADVRFVKCDALKLPFKDKEIGTSFLCELLEHLEKPEPILNEAIRVTRDYLYTTTPAKGVMPPGEVAGHEQDFTVEDLVRMAEKAGLEVLETRVDPIFNYVFTKRK